jgi:hypothetical protein
MYNYTWRVPLAIFPLLVPVSTYLTPSRCDRNGPPQSQVARKLIPIVPHCPLVPSPSKFPTLPGFPEPNVLLISSSSSKNVYCVFVRVTSLFSTDNLYHKYVHFNLQHRSFFFTSHVLFYGPHPIPLLVW